ncbi:MAG TPA: hypothetical protein PL164_02485, partial [Candidatus Paceibacterota bacterium]|nr:hypothetical protein [Candidatus Paceibacterota bacterium]HOK97474.1 hypothetical protein [Candidatus Paceibacterota bacterium]HPP64999.1 hypothetical protein [Candidatus Paceibacterota bacterium]
MAIEIQKEKKGNPFIWLIVIAIIGIGGWFLWQIFQPSKLVSEPKVQDILPPTAQSLIEARLDTQGVLNHPVFQSLTPHLNWPPPPPALGKTNPFQPF